jgi:hypothetical protein
MPQDLGSILWEEFGALSARAQWAYALIAILHASYLPVPQDLLGKALSRLTGEPGYFASPDFVNETADILFRRAARGYITRHSLIAETLLGKLSGAEWEDYRFRLLHATLEALDLSRTEHRTLFDLMNDRKVARVLSNLTPLVDEIAFGRMASIQGRHISEFLNGIVRIYQGRGWYDEGEKLASRSFEFWSHIGNHATYLRAFCQYEQGKLVEVQRAVTILLEAKDYPHHLLHGVTLLCVLKQWPEAKKALDDFEGRHKGSTSEFGDYRDLRRRIDLFLNVKWAEGNLDSLAPALALERIQLGLDDSPQKQVVEQFRRLVRRQHDFFRAFLTFFTYLHRNRPAELEPAKIERLRLLEEECRFHLCRHNEHHRKYPDDVLSLLHSNLARSLLKMDYLTPVS